MCETKPKSKKSDDNPNPNQTIPIENIAVKDNLVSNPHDEVTPPEEKKILGMHKNVFFVGLTSFFTDTTVYAVYPTLPIFLKSILGISVPNIALIEGIAESTASVLKALSGWWSDKIGKNKPFMLWGYLMTAIITPFFGFVSQAYQVMLLRFVERIGKGIRTAPRDSIIASAGVKKSHGRNFGFHKAMDNTGAILGPFFAWLLIYLSTRAHGTPTLSDYKLFFILASIPAFLGVITICLFIKDVKKEDKSKLNKISLKDFDKKFYTFLAIAFMFSLGNSTDSLLLLRAQDTGINQATVPLVYLICNFSAMILSVPIGIISDKIGREKIIIVGYLIYSVVYLGFAHVSTPLMIVALFALYGVYSAACDGIQKALVVDLIGNKHRGTALGLFNAIIGITLLPASVIGGILWNANTNHSLPFIFGSSMAFISAILLAVFYRKRFKVAEKSL